MADKGIPGLPDHVFMAFPHNSAEGKSPALTSHTILLLAREGADSPRLSWRPVSRPLEADDCFVFCVMNV